MSLTRYNCSECGKTHLIPDVNEFSKLCDCYLVLKRVSKNGQITYDQAEKIKRAELMQRVRLHREMLASSNAARVNKSDDTALMRSLTMGALYLSIILLFVFHETLLKSAKTLFQSSENTDPSAKKTKIYADDPVVIYSGSCTLFRQTFIPPDQKLYTKIKTAFAKVVIDKSTKRFSFFFDGKEVGSWSGFDSYVDGQQGGEGFNMSNEWSAHRLTAERTFFLFKNNVGNSGNDLGYEYEISNYRIN